MPKFLREALAGTPRIRPIARPFDEVAFPVARHRTGGHLDGTLGNRRDVGDLAVAVYALRPQPACLARLTQCHQQLAPQGSAWQHIQRHIEGLGRQLFPHVVRILASEAPGNLFR